LGRILQPLAFGPTKILEQVVDMDTMISPDNTEVFPIEVLASIYSLSERRRQRP
jgi:hypothetical protein